MLHWPHSSVATCRGKGLRRYFFYAEEQMPRRRVTRGDRHKPMSGPRVVYIGGVEHNGSTFLGVTLGHHPQIACAGELSMLPREGWCGDYLCACGLRIVDCPFWADALATWEQTANVDVQAFVALEDAIDRNRRLPRLISEKYIHSLEFSTYCDCTRALFHAVQHASQNSVIVDTSKRFSRALALSMVDGIDLRIIHLVRDARGVAYSWSKPIRPRRRTWLDSSLRWNLTNGAFELVRKIVGSEQVMLVRYEDFISEPAETLGQVSDFIGVDLDPVSTAVSRGESLTIGHVGIGNNFLRQGASVRLRSSNTWRHNMPNREQKKVWRLTGIGMRRYGYEL